MVKYKVEVDLKVCISTAACYATDGVHVSFRDRFPGYDGSREGRQKLN